MIPEMLVVEGFLVHLGGEIGGNEERRREVETM